MPITYCSGHGDCDHGTGLCSCAPFYKSANCSALLCPGNCTGHGKCFLNGTCSCERAPSVAAPHGYELADCSGLSCPMGCSGHGLCLQDHSCLCSRVRPPPGSARWE